MDLISIDSSENENKIRKNLPQETIISYKDFYASYLSFVKNRMFTKKDFLSAFDIKKDNAIRLCTFNKKFDNLTQSNNRDEILKDVKYLPHIFYRPKLHLKQEEEVRPASIVTRIGTESIRHLASHSEHWKGIKANGLIPERLLARILEDDYAIYENVVAKTLVDKLYALEKKDKEDTIDCKMSFTMAESYSQGRERQNFFDAIKFLFKGFEIDETSTTQKQIDEILDVINEILTYLSKCKSTKLYRCIKKEKEIKGSLKKTNIFMMDNYYKKVYQLWNILGKSEEVTEIKDKKCINDEYFVYTELVILFALKYMGFSSENEILLNNNIFDYCKFIFKDWIITLSTEKLDFFDKAIRIEFSQKNCIEIVFNNIKLPECEVYKKYKARKDNNKLIFDKKLNDKEQSELCKQLVEYIEKKQQKNWKEEFIKTLSAEMSKVSIKSEQIIFVPWKYGITDDYKIAKETLKQLRDLIPHGYKECYFLNIMRPNELTEIQDEALLNSLVSYSLRNQESDAEKSYGIIPITLNDINSFRRIAKIFLKNMILLKEKQNFCPICGSDLKGDKDNGYKCVTPDCKFEIYNSKCPYCKKRFWYTNYIHPTTFKFDTESKGMKILLTENELGFKNITPMEKYLEYEGKYKPKCPYCEKIKREKEWK